MHTEFHTNWIGKQWLITKLIALCNLPVDWPTVAADRVERDATKRREVMLSLVKAGLLTRAPGERLYTVTQKAGDVIRTGSQNWSELRISINKPHDSLRKLSAPFLKRIYVDLMSGSVRRGPKVHGMVVLQKDKEEMPEDPHLMDLWVLNNLHLFAAHDLDMSQNTSQLVSLRGQFQDRDLGDLQEIVNYILSDCAKEINRLKARQEALITFATRIESRGGWNAFAERCLAIYQLHKELSTEGPLEQTLRDVAAIFKSESSDG